MKVQLSIAKEVIANACEKKKDSLLCLARYLPQITIAELRQFFLYAFAFTQVLFETRYTLIPLCSQW